MFSCNSRWLRALGLSLKCEVSRFGPRETLVCVSECSLKLSRESELLSRDGVFHKVSVERWPRSLNSERHMSRACHFVRQPRTPLAQKRRDNEC